MPEQDEQERKTLEECKAITTKMLRSNRLDLYMMFSDFLAELDAKYEKTDPQGPRACRLWYWGSSISPPPHAIVAKFDLSGEDSIRNKLKELESLMAP